MLGLSIPLVMLFKSQVLTQASGSVGGATYTRTASGMVMRGRAMPVNPNTGRQQVVRNAVSSLSQLWSSTLEPEERDSWTLYANNVMRPNKLGDMIKLSGISMFVRCNTPRVQAGLPVVTTGPSVFSLGSAVSNLALTQDDEDPYLLDLSWTAPGSARNVLIYLSRPISGAINFFRGPWMFTAKVLGTTSSFTGIYVDGMSQGQQVRARVRVSYDDGRLSSPKEVGVVLTQVPVPPTP